MPEITRRINEAGRWLSVITLIVAATVLAWVGAEERTIGARVEMAKNEARKAADAAKKAEVDLQAERERNTAAHAASLDDRTTSKAKAANLAAEVATLKAKVAANEKEIAVLKVELSAARQGGR